MLTVQYSNVNQCWLFMFGDALCSVNGANFIDTLDTVDAELRSVGLKRKETGKRTVYTIVLENE